VTVEEAELVVVDFEVELEGVGQCEEAAFGGLLIEEGGHFSEVEQQVQEDLGEDVVVELVPVQLLHQLRVTLQLANLVEEVHDEAPDKLVVRVTPQQPHLHPHVLHVLLLDDLDQSHDAHRVFQQLHVEAADQSLHRVLGGEESVAVDGFVEDGGAGLRP
jgi:hypothetical protein